MLQHIYDSAGKLVSSSWVFLAGTWDEVGFVLPGKTYLGTVTPAASGGRYVNVYGLDAAGGRVQGFDTRYTSSLGDHGSSFSFDVPASPSPGVVEAGFFHDLTGEQLGSIGLGKPMIHGARRQIFVASYGQNDQRTLRLLLDGANMDQALVRGRMSVTLDGVPTGDTIAGQAGGQGSMASYALQYTASTGAHTVTLSFNPPGAGPYGQDWPHPVTALPGYLRFSVCRDGCHGLYVHGNDPRWYGSEYYPGLAKMMKISARGEQPTITLDIPADAEDATINIDCFYAHPHATFTEHPVGVPDAHTPAVLTMTGVPGSVLTVDFGDGSTPATATAAADGRASATHTYAADGDYTATLSEGGAAKDTTVVHVGSAAAPQYIFVHDGTRFTYSPAKVHDAGVWHDAELNIYDGTAWVK